MPITVEADIRHPTQKDFAAMAYDVMETVFAVHNELGRFLDEQFYKQEISYRLPDSRVEVPIRVTFEDFTKIYFLDLLVGGAAPFELKTVEGLTGHHRAQLINYLLLTELPHGKLVNLRPDAVEHEFVNSTLRREDRADFKVDDSGWDDSIVGALDLRQRIIAALRDWGAGLELQLYREACVHFLGGVERVLAKTLIVMHGRKLGLQSVWLAAPAIALKITAVAPEALPIFEDHARRFLAHTSLEAIQWINITLRHVRFTTIHRTK